MISAQCNLLQTMAAYLVVHDMSDVAASVRDAVDTILELRDDLQRANDGLRDAEHDESVAWDRVRKAEAESAKLRELAADLLRGFECGWPSDVCGDCERDAEGMPTHGCPLRNRARELGVEVE